MKKLAFLSFSILVLISLFSCGSTSNLNKVFVTNTNRVDILPAEAITKEIDEYQIFEATFKSKDGEQKLNATAYLKADSTGIDIVLLNEFGIEMGTISYDGENATMQSSVFPKKLKPEYILLDLQNAYVDSKILKEHYKKYGLDFEELSGCAKTLDGGFNFYDRFISKKGETIESVRIQNGIITIKNHLRGYEFKLTTIEE